MWGVGGMGRECRKVDLMDSGCEGNGEGGSGRGWVDGRGDGVAGVWGGGGAVGWGWGVGGWGEGYTSQCRW